jgi:uncharacterized membrane protein YebE (DUF533 family)
MNKNLKTVLIVAGVAAAAYFAYSYYKKKNPQATPAPTPGANTSSSGSPGGVASAIGSAAGSLAQLADAFA